MPFTHNFNTSEIINLYQSGKTLKEIGEILNCTANTVKRYINNAGEKTRKRGENREENIDGKKFGRLSVIKRTTERNNHGKQLILCQCDCGKSRKICISELRQTQNPTCGDKLCKFGPNGTMWNGHKEISQTMFQRIKNGADRRNINFEITIEDMYDRWVFQKGICSLSGEKLTYYENSAYNYNASLDRIDSKKGYTKDNIQWIHKDINKMKMDLEQEKLINWCKKIASYNK